LETNVNVSEVFSGRLLVTPVEAGAALFGWKPATAHNRVFAGSFPLPLVEIGGKKMVRVSDIAAAVGEVPPSAPVAHPAQVKRGRGRPRNNALARGAA